MLNAIAIKPLPDESMACRAGCGACCIAPSISSPIPGMPQGKPAGVRCVHLNADFYCDIFTDPARPAVCASFQAVAYCCGSSQSEALALLTELENCTG